MVEGQRHREAEQANAPAQVGEGSQERRLVEIEPIQDQANLSTDGAIVLIRTKDWKEVKLTAVSEVQVPAAGERATHKSLPSRREEDPLMELGHHRYQAGYGTPTLWPCISMPKVYGEAWIGFSD